jgi:tetratricopeptide (TPR) repeat protein
VFDPWLKVETDALDAEELKRRQQAVGGTAVGTGRPVAHTVGSNLAMHLTMTSRPEGLIFEISNFPSPNSQAWWRRYNLRSVYGVRPTDEYMLREALGQYELSWAEWWYQRGEDREAAKHLRRSSAIAVDIAPAHNNLAITYANHGRLEEADGELQLALELNPEYAIARQNLEIVKRMKNDRLRMKP